MHSVKGLVSGRVQGVGFRYFVQRHAEQENLCGYARNLHDGRVEFLLQGDAEAVVRVVRQIHQGPAHALVSKVVLEDVQDLPAKQGFLTR